MKTINVNYNSFRNALLTLENSIQKAKEEKNTDNFEYIKDSVIKRMEYCIELSWKLLKQVLFEFDGIECKSPKRCIKHAFEIGYIKDLETRIDMISSRNLSTHTYDDEFSGDLYKLSGLFYDKMVELTENIYKDIK